MRDYKPISKSLKNQNVQKNFFPKNRWKGKALTLLLATAIAGYSAFQDKLPNQYHLENLVVEGIDIASKTKEALYVDNQPKLYDFVQTEDDSIADNSIDNIIIQWEKTKNNLLGEEKTPVISDAGTMYLLQGDIIVKKIPVVGGMYENSQGEYTDDGLPTSPHKGVYDLGFFVDNPEYYTSNGLIASGASNNPFGRGLWTIFKEGTEETGNYEKIQIHGIRPSNEDKGYGFSVYSNLGPTEGCIRMTNDNILLTKRILNENAKITFADSPKVEYQLSQDI